MAEAEPRHPVGILTLDLATIEITVPFCGSITPDTVLRMVVFPAPLAPRMVTMDPRGTSKLTPRMAMTGP